MAMGTFPEVSARRYCLTGDIMTEKNLAEQAISARSRKNLLDAMRGEAFAFAKYKIFANQARERVNTELAGMFENTGEEEYLEHFAAPAALLRVAGTDKQDVNQQHCRRVLRD
jgi:rubrerythrin